MKSIKTVALGTVVAAGLFGAASMTASADTSYTVQPGDTLSKISQKFVGNTSLVSTIVSTNNIANQHLIFAGATITIPSSTVVSTNNVAPVQKQAAPKQYVAPVQKQAAPKQYVAPVQKQAAPKQYVAPVQKQVAQPKIQKTSSYKGNSSSAKAWIANKESGGSYSARSASGKYIGKYQLTDSYLNGDYSPANQEKVADRYVSQRYGSWDNAKKAWLKQGWY
ncbi:peptidase M23 [Kurthia zopfii]|uniref:LysM domain-containing protein n=1 Tax=Kurthia zopfii TaxID=1650 RepID=A0A8B4QDE3_9BACL|nr:LysM peptidoglycan-binding domain-containing protein [Kurthia zopfii]PWI22681.1 peptidase M23 [Kurthia zopfii]TDR39481.1 LysM domain-containing protein [Kurthia zopfii]GEK30550.1 peptidase M23 [Kurthia zopfii]STX10790.1 LysM domain/BON superfamily protein [Kurthia zopfii]